MLHKRGLDIDRELLEEVSDRFDGEAFLLVILVYVQNKEDTYYSLMNSQ
jgi:hypothetical protein